MIARLVHEAAESHVADLRERAGVDGGRFIVDCSCVAEGTYMDCNCVRGQRLAMCDRCADRPADHDFAGELLCTSCRDEAAEEPTVIVPREPMAALLMRRAS